MRSLLKGDHWGLEQPIYRLIRKAVLFISRNHILNEPWFHMLRALAVLPPSTSVTVTMYARWEEDKIRPSRNTAPIRESAHGIVAIHAIFDLSQTNFNVYIQGYCMAELGSEGESVHEWATILREVRNCPSQTRGASCR
jgi:hypothetical protein